MVPCTISAGFLTASKYEELGSSLQVLSTSFSDQAGNLPQVCQQPGSHAGLGPVMSISITAGPVWGYGPVVSI